MAPKRKSELASPEPTPQTKKRGTKVVNADKKRTRDEAISEEEVVVLVEKSRRKKKEVSLLEEPESITPVATVSKVRKSKKSNEVVEIIDTIDSNPKQSTTPAKTKSVIKTSAQNRRKSIGADVTVELLSAAKSPASNNVLSKSSVINEETKNIDKLSDESEIVSVWNQCWDALYLCLTTIGPIFLAVILYCYFAGMVKQSQAIASVGVVYTLLFITIMGTYVVAMLPFILISRVFTSLVAPNGSQYSSAQVNLFCRLTLLIVLVSGLIYHFIH